jgi:hypothetical protein
MGDASFNGRADLIEILLHWGVPLPPNDKLVVERTLHLLSPFLSCL